MKTSKILAASALLAASSLACSAITLLTQNFDGPIQNTQPGQTLTLVGAFDNDFSAVQLNGGGDGIGVWGGNDGGFTGPYSYFNTNEGNYMAAVSSEFTITSFTTELTLNIDLGRRTDFNNGRYIIGFTNNWDTSTTGSSGSGTALGSFTLGGTNGNIVGGVSVAQSTISGGTFASYSTTFSAAPGDVIRAVIIFDNISGSFGQGNVDNFILSGVSAIPEPSSFAALAGAGALGLVALRRRRQARA